MTKIEFMSGMDCPGGEFVSVEINGEYKGKLFDIKQFSLRNALKYIIEKQMCGGDYTCNNKQAVDQLVRLDPKYAPNN
jgi:hypothetical protein